nr:DUF6440 family protein [uncultured Sphingomonas sp.]
MNPAFTEIGRGLARGALIEITRILLFGVVCVVLAGAALQALGYGWDDTDVRGAGVHSQMRLRTDHGTGCQYLETSGGGITPRLNVDGKQVCQ